MFKTLVVLTLAADQDLVVLSAPIPRSFGL